VIYAGLYSATQMPDEAGPCVKVTFPCRGSANVYLTPVAHADGSFGLVSSVLHLGGTGFYRMIDGGPDHYIVRHVSLVARNSSTYTWTPNRSCAPITPCFFLGFPLFGCTIKMTRVPAQHLTTQDEQDLIAVEDIFVEFPSTLGRIAATFIR